MNAVVPLESNPDVFTEFAQKLGMSPLLQFTDIYSLDDPDLVAFLPRPMYAAVLLFPVTKEYETFKNAETVEDPVTGQRNVVWMKQQVKNACGLYALLHAILNLPAGLLVQQSVAANFKRDLARNQADPFRLVQNIATEMYQNFGERGQTEVPNADDDVELHFVTFIKNSHGIYELDGRRNGAVLLKETKDIANADGDVLEDPCVSERVKKYMTLVTEENINHFALMGLAPSME